MPKGLDKTHGLLVEREPGLAAPNLRQSGEAASPLRRRRTPRWRSNLRSEKAATKLRGCAALPSVGARKPRLLSLHKQGPGLAAPNLRPKRRSRFTSASQAYPAMANQSSVRERRYEATRLRRSAIGRGSKAPAPAARRPNPTSTTRPPMSSSHVDGSGTTVTMMSVPLSPRVAP